MYNIESTLLELKDGAVTSRSCGKESNARDCDDNDKCKSATGCVCACDGEACNSEDMDQDMGMDMADEKRKCYKDPTGDADKDCDNADDVCITKYKGKNVT